MNTEVKQKTLGRAITARTVRYQNKSGSKRWLAKDTDVDIIGVDPVTGLHAVQFTVGRWLVKWAFEKKYLKDIYFFPVSQPKNGAVSGGPAFDAAKTDEQKDKVQKHLGDRKSRDEGKLKYSLVDYPSMQGMVRVLMFGAIKYQAFNWQQGMPFTELLESMQRHLAALMAGEEVDPESGEFHEDHIHCNAMFLTWMRKHRPDMDDRYNKPEFVNRSKATGERFDEGSKALKATGL